MKDTTVKTLLQRNIDIIVAIIGIVVGTSLSLFNFVYSNTYLLTMGPMLAIVSATYIFLRQKFLADSEEKPRNQTTTILVTSIVYWLAFAGAVYSLGIEILHRPFIYFILVSLSATMIGVQIMSCQGSKCQYLVLFEIFLLSASIRASAFWVFPTLSGIDSWEHMDIVQSYVNQGHIVQFFSYAGVEDHFNGYYTMPLMHTNAAITQITTGVDFKNAMFLGSSLPLLFSTIFIFLIGHSLFNARVGLLAMLLVNMSDYHIMWSSGNIIAMSFAVALFTIIVYLSVAYRRSHKQSSIAFILLFFVCIIFTHMVSYFITACFLVTILLGFYVNRFLFSSDTHIVEPSIVSFKLIAWYIVAMFGHAIYVLILPNNTNLFEFMVKSYYGSITETAELIVTKTPPLVTASQTWYDPILNISGYLLLLLFGIIGCLLWLSRKYQSNINTGLIASLIVLIGIPLSFPLFQIGYVVSDRWSAFYYVIVSIPAAIALFLFCHRFKSLTVRYLLISIFVFSYTFLMITGNVANTDSPVYATSLNERLAFSEAEVAVTQAIADYNGHIITDRIYRGVFFRESTREPESVSSEMLNEKITDRNMVIWRKVLTERPARITIRTIYSQLSILGESYEQSMSESHNLTYCNKDVKIFLPKISP